MRTDALFFRLFEDRPDLVRELAKLPLPANVGYRLHAEEVKETALRLDGILLPPASHPGLPPIFVEIQCQRDAAFYARWFSEIFLYLYRKQCTTAWRAVAIFARQSLDQAEPAPYAILLDSPWVHRVYLEKDLPDFDHATVGLRLVHLIIADPDVAPAQARRLIAEHPAGDSWLIDWVETILIYKFPRLTREELKAMLNFHDEELKQTQFYQEVFAEGREEGREEGRKGGMRAIVWLLLRRRFAGLPPAIEQRILALSPPDLEALATALLDFASTEQLVTWLDRHR